MRQVTVSLGKDAQIPFETKFNGVSVDAVATPAVEVWVNGVHDSALTASATVTQLQDAAAPVDGSYFVEIDTDALTVTDSAIVKVEATPTGGVLVTSLIAVSFVDPAGAGVSSID